MKHIAIAILFLVFSLPCLACLNGESYLLKNRQYLYMDYEDKLPFGHEFYTERFDSMIHDLDSLYQKTNDLDYLSDKGLILILKKQYDEALSIYQKIEKMEPGRYSTASNMGTIYELIGNNKEALAWIKKAVILNPHSHEESEWLHVRILEAKLQGPESYTSQYLTNLDFGQLDAPKSHLSTRELDQFDKALYFQLNERISFIKPKDKIIALLLFDLANIRLLRNKIDDARQIFSKAKAYGLTSEVLDRRILYTENRNTAQSKNADRKASEIDYIRTFTLIVILCTIIFIVFLALKRRL